jgi:hypothetical protein
MYAERVGNIRGFGREAVENDGVDKFGDVSDLLSRLLFSMWFITIK